MTKIANRPTQYTGTSVKYEDVAPEGFAISNSGRIGQVTSTSEYSNESFTPSLCNALEIDWDEASIDSDLLKAAQQIDPVNGNYIIKNTSDLILLLAFLVNKANNIANTSYTVSDSASSITSGQTTSFNITTGAAGTISLKLADLTGYEVTPSTDQHVNALEPITYTIKNTVASINNERVINKDSLDFLFVPDDAYYNFMTILAPSNQITLTYKKSSNVTAEFVSNAVNYNSTLSILISSDTAGTISFGKSSDTTDGWTVNATSANSSIAAGSTLTYTLTNKNNTKANVSLDISTFDIQFTPTDLVSYSVVSAKSINTTIATLYMHGPLFTVTWPESIVNGSYATIILTASTPMDYKFEPLSDSVKGWNIDMTGATLSSGHTDLYRLTAGSQISLKLTNTDTVSTEQKIDPTTISVTCQSIEAKYGTDTVSEYNTSPITLTADTRIAPSVHYSLSSNDISYNSQNVLVNITSNTAGSVTVSYKTTSLYEILDIATSKTVEANNTITYAIKNTNETTSIAKLNLSDISIQFTPTDTTKYSSVYATIASSASTSANLYCKGPLYSVVWPTSIADGKTANITITANTDMTFSFSTMSGTDWSITTPDSYNITAGYTKQIILNNIANTTDNTEGYIDANAITLTGISTDAKYGTGSILAYNPKITLMSKQTDPEFHWELSAASINNNSTISINIYSNVAGTISISSTTGSDWSIIDFTNYHAISAAETLQVNIKNTNSTTTNSTFDLSTITATLTPTDQTLYNVVDAKINSGATSIATLYYKGPKYSISWPSSIENDNSAEVTITANSDLSFAVTVTNTPNGWEIPSIASQTLIYANNTGTFTIKNLYTPTTIGSIAAGSINVICTSADEKYGSASSTSTNPVDITLNAGKELITPTVTYKLESDYINNGSTGILSITSSAAGTISLSNYSGTGWEITDGSSNKTIAANGSATYSIKNTNSTSENITLNISAITVSFTPDSHDTYSSVKGSIDTAASTISTATLYFKGPKLSVTFPTGIEDGSYGEASITAETDASLTIKTSGTPSGFSLADIPGSVSAGSTVKFKIYNLSSSTVTSISPGSISIVCKSTDTKYGTGSETYGNNAAISLYPAKTDATLSMTLASNTTNTYSELAINKNETATITITSNVTGKINLNAYAGDGWSITDSGEKTIYTNTPVTYTIANTNSILTDKTFNLSTITATFTPTDTTTWNTTSITGASTTLKLYYESANCTISWPTSIPDGQSKNIVITAIDDLTFTISPISPTSGTDWSITEPSTHTITAGNSLSIVITNSDSVSTEGTITANTITVTTTATSANRVVNSTHEFKNTAIELDSVIIKTTPSVKWYMKSNSSNNYGTTAPTGGIKHDETATIYITCEKAGQISLDKYSGSGWEITDSSQIKTATDNGTVTYTIKNVNTSFSDYTLSLSDGGSTGNDTTLCCSYTPSNQTYYNSTNASLDTSSTNSLSNLEIYYYEAKFNVTWPTTITDGDYGTIAINYYDSMDISFNKTSDSNIWSIVQNDGSSITSSISVTGSGTISFRLNNLSSSSAYSTISSNTITISGTATDIKRTSTGVNTVSNSLPIALLPAKVTPTVSYWFNKSGINTSETAYLTVKSSQPGSISLNVPSSSYYTITDNTTKNITSSDGTVTYTVKNTNTDTSSSRSDVTFSNITVNYTPTDASLYLSTTGSSVSDSSNSKYSQIVMYYYGPKFSVSWPSSISDSSSSSVTITATDAITFSINTTSGTGWNTTLPSDTSIAAGSSKTFQINNLESISTSGTISANTIIITGTATTSNRVVGSTTTNSNTAISLLEISRSDPSLEWYFEKSSVGYGGAIDFTVKLLTDISGTVKISTNNSYCSLVGTSSASIDKSTPATFSFENNNNTSSNITLTYANFTVSFTTENNSYNDLSDCIYQGNSSSSGYSSCSLSYLTHSPYFTVSASSATVSNGATYSVTVNYSDAIGTLSCDTSKLPSGVTLSTTSYSISSSGSVTFTFTNGVTSTLNSSGGTESKFVFNFTGTNSSYPNVSNITSSTSFTVEFCHTGGPLFGLNYPASLTVGDAGFLTVLLYEDPSGCTVNFNLLKPTGILMEYNSSGTNSDGISVVTYNLDATNDAPNPISAGSISITVSNDKYGGARTQSNESITVVKAVAPTVTYTLSSSEITNATPAYINITSNASGTTTLSPMSGTGYTIEKVSELQYKITSTSTDSDIAFSLSSITCHFTSTSASYTNIDATATGTTSGTLYYYGPKVTVSWPTALSYNTPSYIGFTLADDSTDVTRTVSNSSSVSFSTSDNFSSSSLIMPATIVEKLTTTSTIGAGELTCTFTSTSGKRKGSRTISNTSAIVAYKSFAPGYYSDNTSWDLLYTETYLGSAVASGLLVSFTASEAGIFSLSSSEGNGWHASSSTVNASSSITIINDNSGSSNLTMNINSLAPYFTPTAYPNVREQVSYIGDSTGGVPITLLTKSTSESYVDTTAFTSTSVTISYGGSKEWTFSSTLSSSRWTLTIDEDSDVTGNTEVTSSGKIIITNLNSTTSSTHTTAYLTWTATNVYPSLETSSFSITCNGSANPQ